MAAARFLLQLNRSKRPSIPLRFIFPRTRQREKVPNPSTAVYPMQYLDSSPYAYLNPKRTSISLRFPRNRQLLYVLNLSTAGCPVQHRDNPPCTCLSQSIQSQIPAPVSAAACFLLRLSRSKRSLIPLRFLLPFAR